MSGNLPPPVATVSTSAIISMGFWAAPDLIHETGGVIIDRGSERVLFVYDELRQMYTLPRSRMEDIGALMRSPLRAAEEKSGLRCSRLALPRLTKRYIVPPDKNWDNLRAKTAYIPSELTTDPFYLSFNTLWYKIDGIQWPDGYQDITYWYSGTIDVDDAVELAPSDVPESQQPKYLLLPIETARERLQGKDRVAHGALSMFAAMWIDAKPLVDKKQ